MAVAGIKTTGTGTTSTTSMSKLAENFDQFLTLLTTQLKNQDPLSPMDTSEFTQQLVSFSSVEQMIQSNQRLEKLINLQSSTNAFGAVSFLGNKVAVDSDRVSLKGGKTSFQYDIDRNATRAVLRVADAKGNTVLVEEANREAGSYKVDWNGKDAFGDQLPDGEYQVSVSYSDETGKIYSSKITSFGVVDSTEIKDGEVKLFIGSVGFPIDKVIKVAKDTSTTS